MLASLLASSLALLVTGESSTLTIHGSGTTNPSKCYWHVMDKMEARAKLPMHMTYRGIGSSSGQAEFTQNPPITAFASGDIPLEKEFWDAFQAEGTTVLQLPVFVGAVSFFHNVPNTPTLNLTACTLAKIMKREITDWGNDEVKSLNPDLTIPSGGLPITVARRVDGSSSTSGITAVRYSVLCLDCFSIFVHFIEVRISCFISNNSFYFPNSSSPILINAVLGQCLSRCLVRR